MGDSDESECEQIQDCGQRLKESCSETVQA